MMKSSPYRYAMGRIRNPYVQLAPILNKIDILLSENLLKLETSSDSETLEHCYNIFLRATNLFHRITREQSIGIREQIENQDVPTSYLEHLISFLKYTQEPLYVLRVASLVAKFARKFKQFSNKHEYLKPFFSFLKYGAPFFKLFEEHSYQIPAFHEYLKKKTTGELKIAEWEKYISPLKGKISTEEITKLLLAVPENKLVDKRIASLANESGLEIAGEFMLLKLLTSKRKFAFYEISALASCVFLVHGN